MVSYRHYYDIYVILIRIVPGFPHYMSDQQIITKPLEFPSPKASLRPLYVVCQVLSTYSSKCNSRPRVPKLTTTRVTTMATRWRRRRKNFFTSGRLHLRSSQPTAQRQQRKSDAQKSREISRFSDARRKRKVDRQPTSRTTTAILRTTWWLMWV